MSAKVFLGDIALSYGPKRKVKYSNPRSIARYDVPGGSPIYQDMGEDETTIGWEGILLGDDAYATALKIETLKNQGNEIDLVFSDFPELSKRVRIRSVPWDLIRQDRVEYTIELVFEKPQPTVSQVTASATGVSSSGGTSKPSSTKAGGRVHVVKQGDTLWAIAVKYYKSGTKWREIAKANKITNPTTLRVGQKLTIPEV